MLKKIEKAEFLIVFLLIAIMSRAQHCAPITDSFLSSIKLNHKGDSLAVELIYNKIGGQAKEKYQIYVFACFNGNRKIVFSTPDNIFNKSICLILNTDLITKGEDGYHYQKSFNVSNLVKDLLATTAPDSVLYGTDGVFQDRFSIGVFIPFLESTQYANNQNLPSNKHECNYKRSPYLMLQSLPYSFTIRFGSRLGRRLKKYFVDITGEM